MQKVAVSVLIDLAAEHPFFLGTLYQPQLTSAQGAPHPVFVGLLAALL